MKMARVANGEVLIKVECAGIHPMDVLEVGEERERGIGVEGSGVVVESGGGLQGWSLKHKRVAFRVLQEQLD